jgi:hypothetical protein
MVAFKTLAAAALVAQGALASPAQDPQLAKRGEGIHLFNCRPFGGAGVTQTWLSLVVVRICSGSFRTNRVDMFSYCASSTAPTTRTAAA